MPAPNSPSTDPAVSKTLPTISEAPVPSFDERILDATTAVVEARVGRRDCLSVGVAAPDDQGPPVTTAKE